MTANDDPAVPQPSPAEQRKQDPDYQEVVQNIASVAASDPHLYRAIDQDESTFCEVYDTEAQRIRSAKEERTRREQAEHRERLKDPEFMRRHLRTFESTPRRLPRPEADAEEVMAEKERKILNWVRSAPDEETNTFRAAKYLQWIRQNQSVEGGEDGEGEG